MLEDLVKRFEGINIEQIYQKILKKMEEQIIDLNTEMQLFKKGIDSDGQPLPMPYAQRTIAHKKSEGQPIDRITLRDTGAFHRGFFVQYRKGFFQLYSKDDKAKKLEQEWGEEIFGLTDESIGFIIPEIIERLQDDIRSG